MRREEGWGFRMGNTCIPAVDSCSCMAKSTQYYKVINLQLNKFIKKNNIPTDMSMFLWSALSDHLCSYSQLQNPVMHSPI